MSLNNNTTKLQEVLAMANNLPDAGGGSVDMSKYFETVGGDTITWDGVADGRYNVSNLAFLISDTVPTLEELKKGGTLINNKGKEIPFTGSTIIDAEAFGMGTGCYIIVDSVQYPAVFVVYEENATFEMVKDGQTISAVFGKKGIYFVDGTLVGIDNYVTSLTINGYTGFTKEVIKEEYLPPMGGTVKSIVFTTVTELYNWLTDNSNKVIKVIFYTGANFGNSTIDFHNVVTRSDGGVFLEKTMAVDYFEGVTIAYYGINLGNEEEGVLLTLRSGSIKFNLDDTMVLRQDENVEINDMILQYMGGNATVVYADNQSVSYTDAEGVEY